MKGKIKKIFKNKLFLAFFYSICLGALIILPTLIYGKGQYALLSDFSLQEISFNMMINESLKEGSFLWTWFNELGSNFIGTFTFYNLFSPFNLIAYIFPASWFPYLVGWIFILKYGVAGLTSYLFLKRYVKNDKYAIIGSLFYAFSGFQLTNTMFYHFHDVVAFFPLLLYTFDNYMYDNKKGWFGLVVALLAFTNWFFFIGQGIFLILYFVIKLICKEYKFEWKKIGYLIFEGICGIGIAMIALLPTALFIISNPRVSNESTLIQLIKHPIENYIELLRAFIFPAEVMNTRSFITESNYTSIEAYLPVVGVLLALGCFFKHPKKWYSILIVVLGIFMCVPVLNSSFFMFVGAYYARWFYMPTLILSLMSIKCLEDKCSLKIPLFINIGLFILTGIGTLLYMWRIKNIYIFYDKVYFIVMVLMAIICLFVTFYICKNMTHKKIKYLIISIFVFVTLWGNYMTYHYIDFNLYKNDNYKIYLNIKNELSFEDVRTIGDYSCYANMGYIGRFNNMRAFNSNLNGTNFEFYKSIGYDRAVSTLLPVRDGVNDKLYDFLGIKYVISRVDIPMNNYKLVKETKNYYIYLNEDYKEFGFNVNEYMSHEEFNQLSDEDKKETLNTHIILDEKQILKYKKLYSNEVSYLSNKFSFEINGFSSKINSSGETLAIYAIPYDKGWRATVNGKEAVVEKVDNGMIAIKINQGQNEIKFTYKTPGLNLGMISSIISALVYGIYFYKVNLKKAK